LIAFQVSVHTSDLKRIKRPAQPNIIPKHSDTRTEKRSVSLASQNCASFVLICLLIKPSRFPPSNALSIDLYCHRRLFAAEAEEDSKKTVRKTDRQITSSHYSPPFACSNSLSLSLFSGSSY
jgi:hypothetical protein